MRAFYNRAMQTILRTADERFSALPGYAWARAHWGGV